MELMKGIKEERKPFVEIVTLSEDEMRLLKSIMRKDKFNMIIKPLDDIFEEYRDYFKDDLKIKTWQWHEWGDVITLYSFNEAVAMKEYILEYINIDGEKHKPRHTILLVSPFKLLLKYPERVPPIDKFYEDEPVAYAFLSDEKLTDRFKKDIKRRMEFEVYYGMELKYG